MREGIDTAFIKEQLEAEWSPLMRRIGDANVNRIIADQGEPPIIDSAPGGSDIALPEAIRAFAEIVQMVVLGYGLVLLSVRARQAVKSEDEFLRQITLLLPGVTLSDLTKDKLRKFYRAAIQKLTGNDE